MNNSNAGGVFDLELQDVEESTGVATLEQSDDEIEFDEVSWDGEIYCTHIDHSILYKYRCTMLSKHFWINVVSIGT